MSNGGSNIHPLHQITFQVADEVINTYGVPGQFPLRNQENRPIFHLPEGAEVSIHRHLETPHTMVRAQQNSRHNNGNNVPQPYFQQYVTQPYQQMPPHFQPQQPMMQQLNGVGYAAQPLPYFSVAGAPTVVPAQTQTPTNGAIVVTTMAPSMSDSTHTPAPSRQVQLPATIVSAAAKPTPVIVQKQPRRSILSIVDPSTNKCINQNELDGQRRPSPDVGATAAAVASSSSGVDSIEKRKPEIVRKDRLELKDGKTAAEVQNRFHDAIVSKALASEPITTNGSSIAAIAHEENGSSSTPPASFTAPCAMSIGLANTETEVVSLHDAVKEHLSLTATKSLSSPLEETTTSPVLSSTLTPVVAVVENGEPNVEPKPTTIKEIRFQSPISDSRSADESPANVVDNGKDTATEPLTNGSPAQASKTASETMEDKVQRYGDDFKRIVAECPNTNLNTRVYSSQFLQFMRGVVKDLKYVQYPRTTSELEAIGIDRGRMPASAPIVRRYDALKAGVFMPDFASNNAQRMQRPINRANVYNIADKMRKKTTARTLIDRPILRNPNVQSAPPPPPPTVEDLPNRAAKPWKPMRAINEVETELLKLEKLKRDVRGLLNKITPTTYPVLAEHFVAMKAYETANSMEAVIDIIFEKAVEEPSFCKLYSDLCKLQVDEEYQITQSLIAEGGEATKPRFCHSIITKCQSTFLQSTKCDENVSRLEEEMKSEELEPAKRDEIKDEIDRIKGKEKRRLNGIIRFIADLYGHGLLINPIINWCAVELVKRYDKTGDDVYIEYAVTMISSVGESYEKKSRKSAAAVADGGKTDEPIEVVFSHLSAIKLNLSQRVRFMIMDLEDLRQRNWKPRRGNTGPKTMDELHKEIVNEELNNQREREEYEKKTREAGRRPGGKSYGGRASADSRQFINHSQTEKRTQAALNANQAGSTLRKDTDLKKVEGHQKLSSSRGGFRWGHRNSTVSTNDSSSTRGGSSTTKDGSPNAE